MIDHDKHLCPEPGGLFVYQTDNEVITRIVAVSESKLDDSLHEAHILPMTINQVGESLYNNRLLH